MDGGAWCEKKVINSPISGAVKAVNDAIMPLLKPTPAPK